MEHSNTYPLNDPKYKIYVGRIFKLRKHKEIPATKTKKIGCISRKKYDRISTFGEVVIILDESNTKVQVLTLEKSKLWIGKFFLYEEMTPTNEQQKINFYISKLLKLEEPITKKERQEIANLLRRD